MKPINCYFIISALLIFSCNSNSKKPTLDSTITTPKADLSVKLIEEYKPVIQGVWVKIDYINEVARTKSPYDAHKFSEGVTTIYFDTSKIKGDSLTTAVGWDNHEGGELTLKFKPGKRTLTIQFGNGDIGYSVNNGDTILTTYQPNESKKIVVTNYKKILLKQDEDDLGYGTSYAINKAIITGKYLCIDTAGTSQNLVFTNSGKVTGLNNFSTYYIGNDFNVGPMNNLDYMAFDLYSKKSESFYFKINKDTLKLYTIKASADSMLEVVDKLRYTLIRQK